MAYKNTDILDDIRDMGDQIEGTPTLQEYRDRGSYSASLLYDRFGSWQEAVEAAGFEARDPQQKIPKADLVAELERLADEVNGAPTIAEMNEKGEYSASSYRERFGSWTDALQAVGIDPSDTMGARVPERELVAEIERVADLCDATPTPEVMEQEGNYSVTTYQERFGSWTDAVEAAGFTPKRTRSLSEDQLIQELHRLWDEIGRPPNSSDLAAEGEHSVTTYQRRFGSWSTALEVAFASRNE